MTNTTTIYGLITIHHDRKKKNASAYNYFSGFYSRVLKNTNKNPNALEAAYGSC